MKKGDVISVVTLSGEYIGKLNETHDDGGLTLDDPRMLIAGDEGVGFARGICMTGIENVNTVRFKDYVYFTPTNLGFEKAYRKAVSGIIL
jgi:hypothetical protein